eukprot:scaffold1501_cov158-Amphora_coffeaeformis.AAC.10
MWHAVPFSDFSEGVSVSFEKRHDHGGGLHQVPSHLDLTQNQRKLVFITLVSIIHARFRPFKFWKHENGRFGIDGGRRSARQGLKVLGRSSCLCPLEERLGYVWSIPSC